MKSGMIVELPDLGEVQVIGEVNAKYNAFKEVWGIGIAKTGRTIMNPRGKLLASITKACKKKSKQSHYESVKAEYMGGDGRLECIKFMAEQINKESEDADLL